MGKLSYDFMSHGEKLSFYMRKKFPHGKMSLNMGKTEFPPGKVSFNIDNFKKKSSTWKEKKNSQNSERERGIRMIYSFRPLLLMKGCRWIRQTDRDRKRQRDTKRKRQRNGTLIDLNFGSKMHQIAQIHSAE